MGVPQVHVLKTWSPWFEEIRDGEKPWEMRIDDRKYCEDDLLVLRLFHPSPVDARPCDHPEGTYGNQYLVRRVGIVHRGGVVPEGFAVMTLLRAADQEFHYAVRVWVNSDPKAQDVSVELRYL
jgi:hypothetical protein